MPITHRKRKSRRQDLGLLFVNVPVMAERFPRYLTNTFRGVKGTREVMVMA